MMYPRSYSDFMLDLSSDSNTSVIKEWAFYLNATLLEEEDRRPENRNRVMHMYMDRIMARANVWFLLDAWEPDEVRGMKVSFVFVDELIFESFKEYVVNAKLNNEMSIILINPETYQVVSEVWIPGKYDMLTNISVFEAPMPGADDYEDDPEIFDNNDDDDGNW